MLNVNPRGSIKRNAEASPAIPATKKQKTDTLDQALERLTKSYEGNIVISFNLRDTITNYSEKRSQRFNYIKGQLGKPEAQSLSLMGEDGKKYDAAKEKFEKLGIIPSLISSNIDILKQYKNNGAKLVLVTAELLDNITKIISAYDSDKLGKLKREVRVEKRARNKDITEIEEKIAQFKPNITTRSTYKELAKLQSDKNALNFKQISDNSRLDTLETGILKDFSLSKIFDAIESPKNHNDLSEFLIEDAFGKTDLSLLTGKTKPALSVYFSLLNKIGLQPKDDIKFIHIGNLAGTDLQFVENITKYNKENNLKATATAVFAGEEKPQYKTKYRNTDIQYITK